MDPSTRRALWAAIEEEKNKEDRLVLLTTHSMEEAEQACSRIGIMVNGQLKCIGSKQHLKDRYGSRYFVFINCEETAISRVDQFMQQFFPGSTLQEGNTVMFLYIKFIALRIWRNRTKI